MPWTSSCSAAVTTSSTERLCPKWITSAPLACRMRRMMLMAASWPSKSDAAVTKRTMFFILYSVCREALRSVMAAQRVRICWRNGRLLYVYVNVKLLPPSGTVYPFAARRILLDRRVAQPQRVDDDRDRTRAHRGGRKHRVQEQAGPGEQHPRGNRHAESVVYERQEQILADVTHRRARKPPRANDPAQVAFDERDACALDRHIGPGAHRDADVGLGECRRVVHPVACHRHRATLGAKRLDRSALFPRQNLGAHLGDAELLRHRLRRDRVVASEHHDTNAFGCERLQCFERVGFDGIDHADDPGNAPAFHEEHHGLAVATQRVRAFPEGQRHLDEGVGETRVAERDGPAIDLSLHSFAGDRIEALDTQQSNAPIPGPLKERRSKRMLAAPLEARRNLQHMLFSCSLGRDNLCEPGLALRQRAG